MESLFNGDVSVSPAICTRAINALSVIGWGVGGIEATAAALGEPVIMKVPEVIGVRLRGRLQEGILATDLALSLTALLRKHDLVQRIVEFCGPGLSSLSIPDRATVANMAPEYGATMGFFPADAQTLTYLRNDESTEPIFSRVIDFDLSSVERTLAGPSRPHDKLSLATLPDTVPVQSNTEGLSDGAVVIASITSCTNTSNPRALVAAGLLAKNAVAKGLRSAPWTKTSFAPGSRVASHLLQRAGLQQELNTLGFNVVGHGCMTCMGNSGPLDEFIEKSVKEKGLTVAAVLSGNRNFEGRIHPLCKLSYLASPPLVVALAIAGTAHIDLASQPIGVDAECEPIMLPDIWPTDAQIDAVLQSVDVRDFAAENRLSSFDGSHQWIELQPPSESEYDWDGEAGFIRKPPFLSAELVQSHLLDDVTGARPLLILGDSVTTDHISPVSRILPDSEAGRWLKSQGVKDEQLASFSARRLNHDVMLRGGFANPRIRNLMVPGSEGGVTRLMPDSVTMPIHEAAQIYETRNVPVIVFGGHGYLFIDRSYRLALLCA
jgi:aconitate hydratase